MKKTIEITTCDCCGQKIDDCKEIVTLKIETDDKLSDFCIACLTKLVRHGLKYYEKHIQKCKDCDGRGKIKEGYYHNCYEFVICQECKGSGFVEI